MAFRRHSFAGLIAVQALFSEERDWLEWEESSIDIVAKSENDVKYYKYTLSTSSWRIGHFCSTGAKAPFLNHAEFRAPKGALPY